MRLCFADERGASRLPYSKAFTKDFEQDYCYDRFWFAGPGHDSNWDPSRILNCGYAFCFAGSASKNRGEERKGFFTNADYGARAHFRNIYVDMGLIAHFQKTALLSASEKLTLMVSREGGEIKLPDQSEVRGFYDHFIEFTQVYWFDEIAPQEQGREMFHMWRKNLRVQELYDEVRQELKDLVDYVELRSSSEQMKASATLNQRVSFYAVASIFVASWSLVAGIFGMNNMEFGEKGTFDLAAPFVFYSLLVLAGSGICISVWAAKKLHFLKQSEKVAK